MTDTLTDHRWPSFDADGNPRHYSLRLRGYNVRGERHQSGGAFMPEFVDSGEWLTNMDPPFDEIVRQLAAGWEWDLPTVTWEVFWWSTAEARTDYEAWMAEAGDG